MTITSVVLGVGTPEGGWGRLSLCQHSCRRQQRHKEGEEKFHGFTSIHGGLWRLSLACLLFALEVCCAFMGVLGLAEELVEFSLVAFGVVHESSNILAVLVVVSSCLRP